MSCLTCGAPSTSDGFEILADPFRVLFRGERIPITPFQASILAKLVRKGRVHAFYLHGSRASGYEHICKIRKALPKGVRIETIREWGYELITEAAWGCRPS